MGPTPDLEMLVINAQDKHSVLSPGTVQLSQYVLQGSHEAPDRAVPDGHPQVKVEDKEPEDLAMPEIAVQDLQTVLSVGRAHSSQYGLQARHAAPESTVWVGHAQV